MSKSLMEDYSREVSDGAKLISEWLRENNHPEPSFEQAAPSMTLPPDTPTEIVRARERIMEASLRIFNLASGPSEFLANMQVQYQTLFAVRWLVHFDIFCLIPLDGCMDYCDIAGLGNVCEVKLKAVMRMAMTNNLFHEKTLNKVYHSATSAMFVRNPGLLDWARFMCDESVPTAGKMVEASQKWPESLEKHETAFNLMKNTPLSFFEYLKNDLILKNQFGAYMKNVSLAEGTKMSHLIKGFNWADLGEAIVVDMGGSKGHCSIALAVTYPNLIFHVQDIYNPTMPIDKDLMYRSLNVDDWKRFTWEYHDFFNNQPVEGADVYLLRMILHDWPDDKAVEILQNIIPAMKNSSRIIIMDTVMPVPGKITRYEEALLRVRDLTMLQVFNSSERLLEDWQKIFKKADKRLILRSIEQPPGSTMSVMEVGFAKEDE